MIDPVVRRLKLGDRRSDAAWWRSRPAEERLRALESIRREYHDWQTEEASDDDRTRLQRVCRVLERS